MRYILNDAYSKITKKYKKLADAAQIYVIWKMSVCDESRKKIFELRKNLFSSIDQTK